MKNIKRILKGKNIRNCILEGTTTSKLSATDIGLPKKKKCLCNGKPCKCKKVKK